MTEQAVVKIRLIGINARYSHSCLALFYIRNELEARLPGMVAEICQYTINDPYYTLFQRLADDTPDYLFFSALIWNSDLVERLIEDLLCVDQRICIVVGGPQAEVVGRRFEQEKRVSVFVGDIEAAGEDFFKDLKTATLKKRYRGSFFSAAEKTLSFPYRQEDFNHHLKNRAVYYESSRGCPFSCTYCLSSSERGLFHKELDQVFSELDAILEQAPETVRFVDRTFNDRPQRALAIWKFLQQRKPSTLFHFEIAPDRFSDEMFDFLATVPAGIFQFEIGIQSTNPETLAAIRRPIDPVAAGAVIRRLRSMENIHLHADLILGLPFETAPSFKRSVNDLFGMQPHYIQMGLLKLLPATEISRQAASWNYRAGRRAPYPVLANHWIDGAAMRALYWLGECIEQCCNNRYFPSLWRYLVGSGEDMAAFFQSLAQRFFDQGYFWQAATQKTLVRLLIEEMSGRNDFALVRELICFDWLRCGHRFLPQALCYQQPSIDERRRNLYQRLPQEIDGLFTPAQRKIFIKTSVFHQFSAAALKLAGFSATDSPALVCFLDQRENSVYRLNKARILQITD